MEGALLGLVRSYASTHPPQGTLQIILSTRLDENEMSTIPRGIVHHVGSLEKS